MLFGLAILAIVLAHPVITLTVLVIVSLIVNWEILYNELKQ